MSTHRSSIIGATLFVAQLGLGDVALAEVPREHKSNFARVKSQLSYCDKVINPDGKSSNLESVARRLETAKELSKDFPGDIPELAELKQRVAACDAALTQALGARQADQKASEDQAAAENAALNAGAEKDLDSVNGTDAALTELASQALGSTATHVKVQLMEVLRGWGNTRAEANRLIAAYGELRSHSILVDRRTEFVHPAHDMWMAMSGLKKSLASTQEKVTAFLGQAPGLVEKELTNAEQGAAQAVAARDADAFRRGVGRALALAEFYVEQAEALHAAGEPGDQGWIAGARARLTRVRESGKVLADGIIKSNKLPEDVYAGADRAALVSAITRKWTSTYPARPLLKVLVTKPEWTRTQRTVWRSEPPGWEKQDFSNVDAFVVARSKDGKYGHLYPVSGSKNHKAGGAVEALLGAYWGDDFVPPENTVLIGSVK